MIQLAAAVWQIQPYETLTRMAQMGFNLPQECFDPYRTANYLKINELIGNMRTLWDTARSNWLTTKSADIQAIRRRYVLQLDVSADRWATGPGLLMGAIHKKRVEELFHPGRTEALRSKSRVFVGRNWNDVLVLPWYDVPGRIRAFSFLGRGGDLVHDQIFRPVRERINLACNTDEAGIAGWPVLAQAGDTDHVIATSDWMLMLQIQLRHLRVSLRPLPIVAWTDNGQYRTRDWSMVAGKKLIFWSKTLYPQLIRAAMENDSHLCTLGPADPTRESVLHWMRGRPGTDLDRMVVEYAKPWPEALRLWAQRAEPGQVGRMIQDVEQMNGDVKYLLKQLEPVRALCGDIPRVARMVVVGNYRITEHGDTWQIIRRSGCKTELLNCRLEMTHAIKDVQDQQLYYYGKVYFKGKIVPFVEKVDHVRDHTVSFIQSLLTKYALGVVAASTKRLLHHAAVSFREPEIVEGELWKWVEKVREELSL